MEIIDIPPHAPTLMESTRAIGYSFEAAIADIIDNSITASASKINIDYYPVDEAFISILDNGLGMSDEEITKAMQYGSQNPLKERSRDDLGSRSKRQFDYFLFFFIMCLRQQLKN